MTLGEVAISALAAGLLIALYALPGRGRAIPTRRGFLLRHSKVVRVTALLVFGTSLLGLIGLLSLPWNRSLEGLQGALATGGIVLAPATLFWCRTRRLVFHVSDSGVLLIRRRGKRQRLRWNEVAAVAHSTLHGVYIMTGRGKRLLIPDMIDGQEALAGYILKRLPHSLVRCQSRLEAAVGRAED